MAACPGCVFGLFGFACCLAFCKLWIQRRDTPHYSVFTKLLDVSLRFLLA
jgi:hypothetical protein